ncbi:hypothetical protein FPOAC1_007509 [Fusarium poae]|uniref:hypothetical protein n=1 Tax=Fusarium poae TaxID=36050 RepID=UPI001CE8CDD8|nr:hypothetical protein FPOAC1_007509 [Fusarium poae]KAG8668138.1 hypothetical protein FPOAC1_007509 [Fusarium poae]
MAPFYDCPRVNATIPPLSTTNVVSSLIKRHLKEPKQFPSMWDPAYKTKTASKKWSVQTWLKVIGGVILAIALLSLFISMAGIPGRRFTDTFNPPTPPPPPSPPPEPEYVMYHSPGAST